MFGYLNQDFYVKIRTGFSSRDKRLFEINGVEITRVDCIYTYFSLQVWGWSGGAMVLGKLPVPERPTVWIIVGQGPTAFAVGAVGGCLDIFSLV